MNKAYLIFSKNTSIKNDYLKHIGDMNMKKEENFDPNVIDDSEFEEVRKSFEEKFGGKK